jgi:Transposase zinc-binding domain
MTRSDVRPHRPAIEIADIMRRHGDAYRRDHAGHLGRVERRVMSAIVACRTEALGGHVEACNDCGMTRIAYNSCLMGTICNGELAGSGDARMPHRPQIPGDCLPFSSP